MTSVVERPAWLDEAFLVDIYEGRDGFAGGKCSLEILSCSGVVGVGDNYISTMYRLRVRVTGETKTIEENLIVKSMENCNPLVAEFGVFKAEAMMYESILPAFEKYYQDAGVEIRFGPRVLKMATKPHDVLILEDLNDAEYFMEDRFLRLDVDHAELTLAKLAKFHAASLLHKEQGRDFGVLMKKFLDPAAAMYFEQVIPISVKAILETLERIQVEPEVIAKVAKWPETYIEELRRITDPDENPNEFHVLVHGDLWLNNQLYRRIDNKPSDVIFIDYQISYWGNPITDIFYFLLSSIKPTLLVENYDHFISYYHQHLVAAMQTLKVQRAPPTLEQFNAQMDNNGIFIATALIEIVPAVIMERHKDATMENMIGAQDSEGARNIRDKMFNNPRYDHTLRTLLPFFEKKGYLVSHMTKGSLPEAYKLAMAEAAKQFAEKIPAIASAKTNGEAHPAEEAAATVKNVIEPVAEPVADPPVPAERTIKVEEAPVPQERTVKEEVAEVKTEAAVIVHQNGMPKENGVKEQPKSKITARIANSISQLQQSNGSDSAHVVSGTTSSGAVPKWLDRFFFRDILQKDYDSFKVLTMHVGPANKKGENYASVMYRVSMKVENNVNGLANRSFIVKINPDLGLSKEMMEMMNLFPKEIEMYTSLVPAFEQMYKKVGENVQFGPKCLLGGTEPVHMLVLDDLKPVNFVNADRRKGLDVEHCEMALEKLAQFHAASAMYFEEKGPFNKHFDHGIFAEHMKPMMMQMYAKTIQARWEGIRKWKCGHLLKYSFDNWERCFVDKIFSVCRRDPHRFNVLNHGDMWSNNIMFKYDEAGKRPQECLFVDLQMCNYNSPALDLHYFIFSSCQKAIKLSHIDHFLEFYHKHLVSNLKRLGYKKPIPTLLQLQVDFLEKGLFGLSTAMGTFAIVVAEGGDDSEMDSFMADDARGAAFRERLFNNPVYVDAMEELIPYFARKGYLDDN